MILLQAIAALTAATAPADYPVAYWDVAPIQAEAGEAVTLRCQLLQSGAVARCDSLGDAARDAAAWAAVRNARARVNDWRPGLVTTLALRIDPRPAA